MASRNIIFFLTARLAYNRDDSLSTGIQSQNRLDTRLVIFHTSSEPPPYGYIFPWRFHAAGGSYFSLVPLADRQLTSRANIRKTRHGPMAKGPIIPQTFSWTFGRLPLGTNLNKGKGSADRRW